MDSDEEQPVSPWMRPSGQHSPKLSLLPLVFLIFYEVSGGPFGIEDSVKAGGPLLALLGFIVFPLIWSVPEALITAEMGTMFPDNGGYVVWISEAFGPFWGFQQGWWKWLSGVFDNALYPVLFLDYLKSLVPTVGSGPIHSFAILIITATLTYVNYRGLTIVGWGAVGLGIFSLLPFCVMAILAVPRLNPIHWLQVDFVKVDWSMYLNTLFWNLNYWDSISTLAGEVENPHRTLPMGMFLAVVLVISGYIVPLLAATGIETVQQDKWSDGYFADVAFTIGGTWLVWWIEAAAALSNMGLFEAEMSSDSFQLLGMSELGMLPRVFATRSVYGTPTFGVLASATGVILLSWMSFQEIIVAENYLYCFGMLAEFGAFIWLRIYRPDLPRPYRVPLDIVGVVLLCIPPTLLLLLVMVLATWKVVIVSFVAAFVGFGLYPCLVLAKQRNWMNFHTSSDLDDKDFDMQKHKDNGEADGQLLHNHNQQENAVT